MKIDINKIPSEGLNIAEELTPAELDLETEVIKFRAPLKLKARVTRITNAVRVFLSVNGVVLSDCSRCLNSFETELKKEIELDYQANNLEPIIDLDPDIREEIILDYPIKPLCKPDCKGLCPKCGEKLNEEKCNC